MTVTPGANPVPLTVTLLPVIPEVGVNELTVGAPYPYRSFVEPALVPPGVVTVTFTLPAASAGAVAVICVLDTNVEDALTDPNFTLPPDLKADPSIVTVSPPEVTPVFGTTLATVGCGSYV
jgi:hypothetical protein